MVRKIYIGILVDRVNEGLIDDKQGGSIAGRGCVDQTFTLKQIGEKAQEKKCSVCHYVRHMIGLIGKHYGRS